MSENALLCDLVLICRVLWGDTLVNDYVVSLLIFSVSNCARTVGKNVLQSIYGCSQNQFAVTVIWASPRFGHPHSQNLGQFLPILP